MGARSSTLIPAKGLAFFRLMKFLMVTQLFLLRISLSENFEFECQIVHSLRTIWKNKPKHSISMGLGLDEPYQLVLQLKFGQFDQICLII